MIFSNKYAKILMDTFPDFACSRTLAEDYELFNVEDNSTYTMFIALSHYLVDEIMPVNNKITNFEIELYNFLEKCSVTFRTFPEGSEEEEFYNAYCTCLLENLLNKASWDNKLYDRFIPYLGPISKEFCKAWDKFTGVRSPGLWADEEWERANSSED